jgi:neutral ceramidase
MSRARPWAAALALGLAGAGCSTWHAQSLPVAASRDRPGTGRLRAGMALVDITPPPGVGMAGSGPEGRRSTGYRTRLRLGALVLEDSTGERIALVVGDLAHVSANLQRLAAARLVDSTGIGADRLIVSATHTHSGPAHFYAERQYNSNVSRVPGYDPRMADFLVERITEAVRRAVRSLRPAAIAWGQVPIVGATFNRSMGAFCADSESKTLCDAGPHRDSTRAVDTMLVMLRVDTVDTASGRRYPLGSYSVFALHGTSIPSINTLLDGDAHVRIVDRMTLRTGGAASGIVHLLANGAEGDAAPNITRDSCDTPALGYPDPVPMPRGPAEGLDFVEPPPARNRHCLDDALRDVDQLSDRVATAAVTLYDTLASRLGTAERVRRSFTTVWLPGSDGLCAAPVVGSSTAAGAEQLETRVRGWDWLMWPLLRLGLEEGGSAREVRDGDCQSPKRALLRALQAPLVVGEHGFPETAQLTLVRIGSVLLAAVPAELTTIAARRLLDSVEAGARVAQAGKPRSVLVGLADGFLQYVTTKEEYGWQAYEGGSDLYGPGMAAFLTRRFGELARRLPPPDGGPSPPVEVGPITAYPGPPKSIMASPTAGPDSVSGPVVLRCEAERLVADWLDRAPGRIFPRPGPWVELQHRENGGAWEVVALDGDGLLEIHALGSRGKRGFAWRAVWRGAPAGDGFRLAVLDGALNPTRLSNEMRCGGAPKGK